MRAMNLAVGAALALMPAMPVSAAVMIAVADQPQPTCHIDSPACDLGMDAPLAREPVAAEPEVPAPAVAGLVGMLALGLAFVRRSPMLREVVC